MWLGLRLSVLKAGQFFMFVSAEVMTTVIKTNMLQLQCIKMVDTAHHFTTQRCMISCWYYHMRSFPSEVCMYMLPRNGCIFTACGHLQRYAAQDMQKDANCYVSHNSTTMSTIRAKGSDCHLACCINCKICSRTEFARGHSKNVTLILSQLLQGGKCCLMSKKRLWGGTA